VSVLEIVILLALTAYAIVRQTRPHEVVGHNRFTLATIYAIVGVAVGGFSRPDTAGQWLLLLGGLALSVVVGLARGRLTRVVRDADGRVLAQGTATTIGLFVGLVVAKFALGALAYFLHINDDGGFGEVLVMIAVMVAFQAELVWRRARALDGPDRVPAAQIR
jgi:hypothetical protein